MTRLTIADLPEMPEEPSMNAAHRLPHWVSYYRERAEAIEIRLALAVQTLRDFRDLDFRDCGDSGCAECSAQRELIATIAACSPSA